MARPLVSDELWGLIEPLIARVLRRHRFPGRKRLDDRKVLTGILFVLQTGIPWEYLRQNELLLAKLNEADRIDWSRAAIDSSHVRAFGGAKRPARALSTAPGAAPSII